MNELKIIGILQVLILVFHRVMPLVSALAFVSIILLAAVDIKYYSKKVGF